MEYAVTFVTWLTPAALSACELAWLTFVEKFDEIYTQVPR